MNTSMHAPLENKLALVAGASGSIGSAVARRLAADGAAVLGHYGSSREAAEAVVREIKIADAVAFLAGSKAGFINGESLTVDGGWNA